jgi:hypothetical protein
LGLSAENVDHRVAHDHLDRGASERNLLSDFAVILCERSKPTTRVPRLRVVASRRHGWQGRWHLGWERRAIAERGSGLPAGPRVTTWRENLERLELEAQLGA